MAYSLAEGEISLEPGEQAEVTTTISRVATSMEVTVPVTGVDIGRLHHVVHRDEDGGQSIKLKREGGDGGALTFQYTVFSEDRG